MSTVSWFALVMLRASQTNRDRRLTVDLHENLVNQASQLRNTTAAESADAAFADRCLE